MILDNISNILVVFEWSSEVVSCCFKLFFFESFGSCETERGT